MNFSDEFNAFFKIKFPIFKFPIFSYLQEKEILFPMCLDKLSEKEWYEIYRQSPEIGFCLYDPTDKWQPKGVIPSTAGKADKGKINLPRGSFSVDELTAILNTIPFDLTFVDKNDTVRYFMQGKERIFARNREILARKVQRCHPPSSVYMVEQIISDFKSGKQDNAAFWINLGGRFIHIQYFSLRNEKNKYLGILEVSQNLTGFKNSKYDNSLAVASWSRILSFGVIPDSRIDLSL